MALLLCFCMLSGCGKESMNAPGKQHSESKPSSNTGMDTSNSDGAKLFKDKKLANFPSASIGDAFDRYTFLTKKEWKIQRSTQNKNIYIDFIGWLDSKSIDDRAKQEGVTERGVELKFIIYPDGSFVAAMVSKLEMKNNGKRYAYPMDDLTGILTKIYANKEIKF